MPDRLVSPRILFRFVATCHYRQKLWTPRGAQLGEEHRLPALAELDDRPALGDVRAAWSEEGLAFSVRVSGKKQPPWCRESHMDESDGLQLWIDTRNTQNIHRASRFCHRFVFLPAGGGGRRDDPCAGQLLINRAREIPKPAEPSQLKVKSEKRADGYLLDVFLAAGALTGYDPAENQRLGFTYQVADRELGLSTFSVGPEYPYQEDPSLWGTLELVR